MGTEVLIQFIVLIRSSWLYFLQKQPSGSVLNYFSIWNVMSSSPTHYGHIKPKTLKQVVIGRDCSFAKSTAFRENHGNFRYDLKNGGLVSQQMWHIKKPSPLKAGSAKHKSNAALSPVMATIARQLKNCLYGSKHT